MFRKRPILSTCLGLFLAFVLYMVLQLAIPSGPIVVSKETTFITEPLAADGLPDFTAYTLARAKEGVTPENNGAIPMIRAMWPARLVGAHQERVCAELGMEVPADEGLVLPWKDEELRKAAIERLTPKFEGAGDMSAEELAAQHVGRFFVRSDVRPWTRQEMPWLAEWVDSHDGNYRLLYEAADRPKFYAPLPELLESPSEALVHAYYPLHEVAGQAATCLAVRALGRIGEGEYAAACDDIEVIYRLARRLPASIAKEIELAISVEYVAEHLVLMALGEADLDAQAARRLLEFLQQLPERNAIARAIDEGERCRFVSAMLVISGARKEDRPPGFELKIASLGDFDGVPVDWNEVLRTGNRYYDQTVAALELPVWADQEAALEAIKAEMQERGAPRPGNIATAAIFRGFRTKLFGIHAARERLLDAWIAIRREEMSNVYRKLHVVAAALAVYRLEQGELPASLDALVPDLLPVVPVDLFSNSPIAYQRTGNGYLLYSFGANGVDEGGSNAYSEVYQGYHVTLDNQNDVHKLLGLPVPTLAGPDSRWPELIKQLAGEEDDLSIRLPLVPLFESEDMRE